MKGDDMKRLCAVIFVIGLIWPGSIFAKVYRYVDSEGQERFTNDFSTIPADKISGVTESDEIQPDDSIPPAQFPAHVAPSLSSIKKASKKEALQKKKALEEEYNVLLKAKEALDNDKSFQKRRKKRKYKHRPYIKELVKKEAQIIERLAEVEEELKRYQ
jgi:hypothetical protein